MTNPLSYPRETGSEKANVDCPICGQAVPAVTSAYGSVSVGACVLCWPTTAPTQLAAQLAAADIPETADEAPVTPRAFTGHSSSTTTKRSSGAEDA